MKNSPKSRREFLLKFISKQSKSTSDFDSTASNDEQIDKIKMLTPDGKLVEVDSRIVKDSKQKIKASNSEILKWMKNTKDRL